MRVVLDTNVIIAGLAYPAGPPGRVVAAWRNGGLQVVVSPGILAECVRVLPRLRAYAAMSSDEIRDLVECLSLSAELIEPGAAVLTKAADARIRDASDEPVLAALLAADAQHLVTGATAICWRYPPDIRS